ncbi:helix-turn-helix transcriptional regulator [Candidatus Woesearchaeota archaeon]|nr:helix-turn-helix transcriptional regulator [Candidatus Woesearchaeota archaeon]
MDIEDIYAKNNWSIIKELAKKPASASELAKKTGQTTANASIKLKILEAQGYVKKTKQDKTAAGSQEAGRAKSAKGRPGKPKTPYELIQELATIAVIRPGLAERKTIRLKGADTFQNLLFNTLVVCEEDTYSVMWFCCRTGMLKKAETIAHLRSEGNEIELFIITDHLQEVRAHHSHHALEDEEGKTKKIISWSHNRKEVEEGLERGEEYFINLVKNSQGLIDQNGFLSELKRRTD